MIVSQYKLVESNVNNNKETLNILFSHIDVKTTNVNNFERLISSQQRSLYVHTKNEWLNSLTSSALSFYKYFYEKPWNFVHYAIYCSVHESLTCQTHDKTMVNMKDLY